MARRRRKVNKRVVLLLSVLGVFVLVGGGALIYGKLPKDPTKYAQRAKQAYEAANYRLAMEQWQKAIEYGPKSEKATLAKWCYLLANVQIDWIEKRGRELNRAQQSGLYSKARANLYTALRYDPSYLDARRMLCEKIWRYEALPSGNYTTYIDEANKLLKLDPKDHLTHYRRSVAYAGRIVAMGEEYFKKAMADIQKAVTLKPDEVRYWLWTISLLRNKGLDDQAEQTFLRAEKANPHTAEIRVRHAYYLLGQKRKDDALKAIRRAIEVAPKDPTGYLALAQFHMSEAKYAEVEKDLDSALKIDDTNTQAYLMMARLYMRQKKPDEVVKVLHRGLETIDKRSKSAEDDAKRSQQLEIAKVGLTHQLASALLDKLQRDVEKTSRQKILDEVKACLASQKKSNAPQPYVDAIAGRIALAEGKPDEALPLLRRAYDGMLQKKRVDAHVAFALISLYDRQRTPGESEKILNRLLQSRPNNSAIWKEKAKREIRLQRFGRALAAIRKVLELDKNDTEARSLRQAIEAATNPEPTVPKDLQTSPQIVSLLLQKAVDLWMDEHRDKAVRFAEGLLQNDPKNLRIIRQLLAFYIQQGRIKDAKGLLDKAIAENPGDESLKFQAKLLAEKDREKRFLMRMSRLDKTLKGKPLALSLAKARLCAMWNKDKEYLRYLREAEKLAPKSVVVIERLFSYAVRKRDWKLAEQYARKAHEDNLDRVDGKTYRVRLMMAKNEFKEAIPILNEILTVRPELKVMFAWLGECYLQTGELDEAQKAFEEAVSLDPAYGQAVIGLARVAERQGKLKELDRWVLRARQLPSVKTDPYIEQRYLRIEEKQAPIDKIISQLIPKREAIFKRTPSNPENCIRLGVLYERVKRYADAEKMYRYIYKNITNKLSGASILADFYLRRKRTPEIAKLFDERIAQAKTPEEKVKAWVAYGNILGAYDLSQALGAMDEAIKIDRNFAQAYSVKARILAKMGRWKDAVSAMQNYLAKLPKQSTAQEKRLVRYMIIARDFDQARQRLDRILKANPSDAQATLLKGDLYAAQGEVKVAIKLYESAAALNPNYAPPYRALAQIYRLAGDMMGAQQALQKARTISDDPGIALQLARVYFRNGDFAETERTCFELLRGANNAIKDSAYRLLLRVYLIQKNWSAMAKSLAEAQKTFPKKVIFRLIEADMWQKRGDADRSVLAYDRALQLAPDSLLVTTSYLQALLDFKRYDAVESVAAKARIPEAQRSIILAYRAAAMALQHKTPQADKLFVEAIKKAAPSDFVTIVRLIAEGFGPDNASVKLGKWIALRPKEWALWSELSRIRWAAQLKKSKRDYSQALSDLQKALDLADTKAAQADIHYRFGLIYYGFGKSAGNPADRKRYFGKAESEYRKVLDIQPDNIGALNNLAYLYSNDLNEPAKAIPYARRAVEKRPRDGNIIDTYGWTLAKLEDLSNARDQLQLSVKYQPMAINRYHLGRVLQKLRNFTEAETQFELALGMAQDSKSTKLIKLVKKALEQVRKELSGKE